MAEILGVGLTHYPGYYMLDADMSVFLRRELGSGRVPPELQDPTRWPALMREEWANDQGAKAAIEHRRRGIAAFRALRERIDAFRPDLVLMWGDDQYENFVEDVVPPFCLYILDRIESYPHKQTKSFMPKQNIWGEAPDMPFVHRGHAKAARFLANELSKRGIDVPYSYRLRYPRGLAHAFINTLTFLDYDRKGFDYPLIPFHVNFYGGDLIRRHSNPMAFEANEIDPPAPSAKNCFDIGRAIARIFKDSKFRVALIASSSWSHASLTDKHHRLFPDQEADHLRLAELKQNRFDTWRDLESSTIVDAGQHEFLNWVCLGGAMTELGAKAEVVDYLETHVFNSTQCFAVFHP